MMRAALSAAALAAGIFSAAIAHAAPPAKAELLNRASAGAQVCAQNMSDIAKLAPALKDAGMKLREANGQLRAYTDSSNRVLVAVTTRRNNGSRASAGCIVAVHGMTQTEAAQLIAPWIKMSGAQPIAPKQGNPRWLGQFKGTPIMLMITPKADFDFIDGAAIVAASPN